MNEHVTVARKGGSGLVGGLALNNGTERIRNWNWTSLVRELPKGNDIHTDAEDVGQSNNLDRLVRKAQGRISLN